MDKFIVIFAFVLVSSSTNTFALSTPPSSDRGESCESLVRQLSAEHFQEAENVFGSSWVVILGMASLLLPLPHLERMNDAGIPLNQWLTHERSINFYRLYSLDVMISLLSFWVSTADACSSLKSGWKQKTLSALKNAMTGSYLKLPLFWQRSLANIFLMTPIISSYLAITGVGVGPQTIAGALALTAVVYPSLQLYRHLGFRWFIPWRERKALTSWTAKKWPQFLEFISELQEKIKAEANKQNIPHATVSRLATSALDRLLYGSVDESEALQKRKEVAEKIAQLDSGQLLESEEQSIKQSLLISPEFNIEQSLFLWRLSLKKHEVFKSWVVPVSMGDSVLAILVAGGLLLGPFIDWADLGITPWYWPF